MTDEERLLRRTAARIAEALRPANTDAFTAAGDRIDVLRAAGLTELRAPGTDATAAQVAVVAAELARALAPVRYLEDAVATEGRRPGADGPAVDAFALALAAADLVGTARGALDDAVEYVRTRKQFGRAVGGFQAVAHLAAEAAVDLAAAEAFADHAAWGVDHLPTPEALSVAYAARAVCAEAAIAVCETAIQLLGGIGMTWEHLAHMRLRRAHELRLRAPGVRPAAPLPDLRGLDSPDEAAFRGELAAWADGIGATAAMSRRAWHRLLYDAGYVGVSFPVEAGGRGLAPAYEAIVNDELGFRGLPPVPPIGHLAHAIRRFGTAAQREEYLPGLLSGKAAWCQGFSEPEAGSDLAALATRARRDGDAYVVDGTKIWTSDAVDADHCLLLCRTGEPGHRGLSVLLVPMDAPGVRVVPIVTAFETREFAQVFLDGVRVPAAARLGGEGDGWGIAMALLGYERGPADIGWTSRLAAAVADMRDRGTADPVLAHRLDHAEHWLYALRLRVRARLAARTGDDDPGPEGSIDKLLLTRVDQLVGRLRLDLAGPDAMTGYLWSRAAGIYGGTAQIQRDIVAQRVLGLPRAR
ncbi:acyl-CoA dehydrogenase family protein [Yinghuangia soli]|uniref:Acyl-CoA dehydrogenase family protein n=1 Tax=Yinghuangia soli TaxID=2908204 RepID=A0AA41Q754_9ACTN|nr:acyl-CoA dehydrogenase family protein [Yinghuangia soli]MCF2532818.1 acyl-CoA dehydrogenase family protein [Yinghuangia soli]